MSRSISDSVIGEKCACVEKVREDAGMQRDGAVQERTDCCRTDRVRLGDKLGADAHNVHLQSGFRC